MTHALRLGALAATLAAAAGAHAQPAAEVPAAIETARRALFGREAPPAAVAPDALSAAVFAAGALGGLDLVAAAGPAFAARRPGDARLIAFNPTDGPVFLTLPGAGVPAPWVAVAVSRDAGPVPSLVALLDDHRAVYGLRVPARATVTYRPAAPADIRPRGLDE